MYAATVRGVDGHVVRVTRTVDGGLPMLNIIGLSAAALIRDMTRANDAGFYRYLTKPVKVDELMQVLEQLLEGS